MKQNEYLKILVDKHSQSLQELGTYDMLLEMSDFTELAFIDNAESLVKLTKEQLYNVYQEYKDYDHKVAMLDNHDISDNSVATFVSEYNRLIDEDLSNNMLMLATLKTSLQSYLSFNASTSINDEFEKMRLFVAHNTIIYNAFAEQQLRLNVEQKELSFAKLDNAQLVSNKALLFIAAMHDEFMQNNDAIDYTVVKLWKNKSNEINEKLKQFEPIVSAMLFDYKHKHINELQLTKEYDDIKFDTYIKLQSFEVVYECWIDANKNEGFTKFDFKHKNYKSHNDYLKQLANHIINCRYKL